MAVTALELDFWPNIPELHAKPIFLLRRNRSLILFQGLQEYGDLRAVKVWSGRCHAPLEEHRLTREALQAVSWQPVSSASNLSHRESKERRELNKCYKPAWVPELDHIDAGIRRLPVTVTTSGQGGSWGVAPSQGSLLVETCWKLCENGQVTEAVDALHLLVQRGCHIPSNLFYRALKRCIVQKDLILGRHVHALTVTSGYESNVFLANHLICMYASHGSLSEAMQVFSKVSAPDVYMWASIILACAKHGQPTHAIALYRQMRESNVKPDNHIYVAVLKACASAGELAFGKDVHDHIHASTVKPDLFVQSSLVDMYAKCGSIADARKVFDGLARKDVVTWNAIIVGYAQQGLGQEALSLYSGMQLQGITQPNGLTFASLLQACASVAALHQGRQLHAQIEKRGLQADVVVGNSLVSMYAKCGSLEDAQKVFDRLSQKDVVTWNAMIGGYAQEGMSQEALSVYSRMQQEGITPPDCVTFASLLQACASMAALRQGKQLHAQIEERGLRADVVVGTTLVNMYAKCGSLENAREVFDSLHERDIMAWGALIAGYTRQGDSEVVFDLLHRMRQDGIQPNGIIFLSVLTVCSHVGLVDKGRMYFESMSRDYGITPTVEHHTCMVDLLGRAGQVEEALGMVKRMPFRPDGTVWLTLLGACRKWSNVAVGQHAFESAVRLDEKDSAAYVLMSNIYADAQMWQEAQEMQTRRVKCGAWKETGQSWWTDMDGLVHSFVVGDKKHPGSEAVDARMEQPNLNMQKEGYAADAVDHVSLRDIADDEKQLGDLCGHSQKVAIAYALNNTSEGTTIHVEKNLWVCSDCHTAMADVSKVEKRTIICRDASRLHVYKEGKCSCGDYA